MNDRPKSRPPRGTPRLRTIVAEPCSPRSIALRTELNPRGSLLYISSFPMSGKTGPLSSSRTGARSGCTKVSPVEWRRNVATSPQRNLIWKGRGRWKNRNEEIVCVLCVHARVGQRNARTIRRNVLRFALFLPPRSELTTRNSIY